jgi:hypothetical protein
MACIPSTTTSLSRISQGIDFRKPAYRARLRIKANKHGNRPSKACDRARSHESKPTSMPIDLRKPNPSYDNCTIDTLSTYPLLLYPTDGYQHQHNIGTSTDYVSVGDKWCITSPYLQSLDTLRNWSASRLQSSIGTPTDRSLCHTFVALSYRWISTPSLSL